MKSLKLITRRLLSAALLLAVCFAIAGHASVTHAQDLQTSVSIPSLNINAAITEIKLKQFPGGKITWDTLNLGLNVGHLEGTAWLDAPGNIVLGAHSELAERTPGIFYTLDRIKTGDAVVLANGSETRTYTVTQIYQVEFKDLNPIYPASSDIVTLITCDTGSYNASTGVYNKRLIVVAERSG